MYLLVGTFRNKLFYATGPCTFKITVNIVSTHASENEK